MDIKRELHLCQCPICQLDADHFDKELHHSMNLLLSRLDEQQRRWYVALESRRLGRGGDRLMCLITGMDEKTIMRGREELERELADRPVDRIRLPGAGRPLIEKKRRGDRKSP